MNMQFTISRADGRSNTQVLCDVVHGAEPGRIFSYEELADALSRGTTKKYDTAGVRQAVIQARHRLLTEHRRALRNVRHKGYRVAPANEHNELAILKKRRADVQMRHGLMLLENVDYDAMTASERNAHQGTLLVVSGLYQNMKAYQRRTDKRLEAIEERLQTTAS